MSETKIFGDEFIEKHSDSPKVMDFVDEVNSIVSELLERYGVNSWQELPADVLETLEITVDGFGVAGVKHE